MTDYQVADRAVRAPMRKWWWRTGSWLIALVLLLQVIYLVYELKVFYAQYQYMEILPCIAFPLTMLLWILAGQRINSILDNLTNDQPEVVDPNWLILPRLHLMLKQGWWSLGLFATGGIANVAELFMFSEPPGLSEIIAKGLDGLTVFPLVVPILYISALMALPRLPRLVPWMLYLGHYGAMIIYIMGLYYSIPICSVESLDSPWINTPLALLGIGISLLPLYLISAGKHRSALLIVVLMSIMMFTGRSFLGCDPEWSSSNDICHYIDVALAYSQQIPILESMLVTYASHKAIYWSCLGLNGTVALSVKNALLFLLIHIPILIGHYFLIRLVITPRNKTATS